MIWAASEARMGKTRKAYIGLVGNL